MYMLLGDHTLDNVKELFANPNTRTVFTGQLLQPITAGRVYDTLTPKYPNIVLEPGDYVLVSIDHDGTEYFNFMSEHDTYHYRALMSGDTEPIVNIIEEHHHV